MAEEGHVEHAAHGVKGFLSHNAAGLPVWAWLLVVAAGIGVAYIFPKIFGSSNSPTDQSGNQAGSAVGGTSGLGLAVDPTTGLPYAVEGLVPSGGTAGQPTASTGQSTGTTATQATPDMTATNNLLQQLLNQLQNPPTPTTPAPVVQNSVPVKHKHKSPSTPPTHQKTVSSEKVQTSPGVATHPIPRPKTPTTPAVPVPSPVQSRPKVAPRAPVTGSRQPTPIHTTTAHRATTPAHTPALPVRPTVRRKKPAA